MLPRTRRFLFFFPCGGLFFAILRGHAWCLLIGTCDPMGCSIHGGGTRTGMSATSSAAGAGPLRALTPRGTVVCGNSTSIRTISLLRW